MNSLAKLKGLRVALLGGAGFIGHNLALKLKEQGAEPYVIDGLQVNHLGYYTTGYTSNPHAERYINFLNARLQLLRNASSLRLYEKLGFRHFSASYTLHLHTEKLAKI